MLYWFECILSMFESQVKIFAKYIFFPDDKSIVYLK